MFVSFMGNAMPKATSRRKGLCWLTFPEDEGHNGSEDEGHNGSEAAGSLSRSLRAHIFTS